MEVHKKYGEKYDFEWKWIGVDFYKCEERKKL